MHKSYVIEIDGSFVGAALTEGSEFRFVAVDVRLDDLDGSCWPTLEELRRASRRMLAGAARREPPPSGGGTRAEAMSPPGWHRSLPNANHGEDAGLQRTVLALREQVMALASISGMLLGFFCKEGVMEEASEEWLFSEVRNAVSVEPEPARLEWERIVAAVQNVASAVAHNGDRPTA